MAKTLPQKTFEHEFQKRLDQHTVALVGALRRITTAKPPAIVKILWFEIFSDWDEFPVTVFALNDDAPDEVYFKPPFSDRLLKRAGCLIPENAIDQDAYEEAGVATFETGARLIAEWFGKCWHKAGGAKFPLPAYIGHHDRQARFDLRKRKWTIYDDIWA